MGKLKTKLDEFFTKRSDAMDAEDERLLHKLMRSSYFHDYYEGYTEYTEKADNLRGYKIRRVYTGKYYRQKLSDGQHHFLIAVHITLMLLCLACLCIGAALPALCNYLWFVTLPQALSILLLFRDIWALIMYVAGGRKLKIRDYKSGPVALKKVSFLTFCSLFLLALSAVLSTLMLNEALFADWLGVMLFALAAAAMLAIWLIERNIEYVMIANESSEASLDGFQIDSV